MDFISFENETLRWVATQPQAEKVKEKWEENPRLSWGNKVFLETTCIEWLQKYLSYQQEALKKTELYVSLSKMNLKTALEPVLCFLTEPPLVKVSRRIQYNGMETLVCRVYGFYPKEMDATWRKDGEVWEQDTFRGGVLPNSDRTYHAWLSIEVDPKERDLYRCYVVHAGVPEPLSVAWKEPGEKKGLGVALLASTLPPMSWLPSGWRQTLPGTAFDYFALPQFPPQPMEPHSHSLSAVRLPPWIQTRTGA
uniref:Ig-like domain-containing protein n=1 Tax=Naja naja TaxID=35670 RepID=A0A8C6X233_NAJNA